MYSSISCVQVSELTKLARELQQMDLPPPYVGEVFSFEDAPLALRRFQTGQTVGKVVLEVQESPEATMHEG